MATVKDLTPAQCILLTVHYASEANIRALHSLTPARLDALDPDLVLRILLTYLPESIDPREYTTYVGEVASRLYLDVTREEIVVDTTPVRELDNAQAQRRVKKLKLLEMQPPKVPPNAPHDLVTWFLCHRAQRIDQETGLLNLIPHLIEPFLERNDYIRTWFISIVLPVVRMTYEYYPQNEKATLTLRDFEAIDGEQGIDLLLARAQTPTAPMNDSKNALARDLRGLVGPWMYGHTERKRRKLMTSRQRQKKQDEGDEPDALEKATQNFKKISLDGVSKEDKTGHDWEYAYRWMVERSIDSFPLITGAIEQWDGPGDVDLGNFDKGHDYLEEEIQRKLELQYAQAAFATCYAAQADTEQTVQHAHDVLARLAELLDFVPPPDLATSVESLPHIERHATLLDEDQTVEDLEPAALLAPEHPLTTPRLETYMLLQMMVYSAYQFAGLGHSTSLVNVAKLHFYATADEQLAVLRNILHKLAKRSKRDQVQWVSDRAKLLWLWNWGIDPEDSTAQNGAGVLGKIDKEDFEEEMLKVFTETSCFNLATKMILQRSEARTIPQNRAEQAVLGKALEVYDAASNGNRTRGGMKKASEIVNTFHPYFSGSVKFRQAAALISATHALSFYALTLQHGVPFQPVNIRVSKDPIGLISKVLEQNPRSYTKLDDLIDIGQNLVLAGLSQGDDGAIALTDEIVDEADLSHQRKDAERRVTFMAIEAALREDDFETAYSYVVNRLSPPTAEVGSLEVPEHTPRVSMFRERNASKASARSQTLPPEDDISWRAAFLAGRYRPADEQPHTLRRLEQRTELLSLALLLAPVPALNEILTVWRRCEEETAALRLVESREEEDFDDRADRREQPTGLPGNFTWPTDQPAMILNQKRREVGRLKSTSTNGGGDEAPVSMFDLTRKAARAFSMTAFPSSPPRSAASRLTSTSDQGGGVASSLGAGSATFDEDGNRIRRRDMVASAVSGGLASGLGWVLGATPVNQRKDSSI